MLMWLRLAGAVVVTLAAMGALEFLGASSVLDRAPDEVREAAHGRSREIFWFLIFAVVMATALLAAVRRWAGQLRRAVKPARISGG
jgi:hypothetical protein